MTRKDVLDKVVGILVEEVAHRVDEEGPRPLPAQGLIKALGPELEVETVFIRVAGDPLQGQRDGKSQEVRRYDDRPRGLLVEMEANVMIQTLRSLTEEVHRKRVAAARTWAGGQ